MRLGDEFLATIRVYYTGANTCGGGREFEDLAHGNYSFDESDFESLTPVPKALPTRHGAVIKIETLTADNPIVAVLREDGRWATNRQATPLMDPSDIIDTQWLEVAYR